MTAKSPKKVNVKMAVGLSSDDELLHIDDAKNGKACKATCIDCGCPLIAKNRGKVAYHYAHDPEFYKPDECNWQPETELHLMAKMVIAADQKLRIPIGTIEPNFREIHFESIELEKRLVSRIPDITAYTNGERILIEVAVTHKCDSAKISEMKRANNNCVEIDLSEFSFSEKTITLDAVRNFIGEAPLAWLSISPVGEIGRLTYLHNLEHQCSLASSVKKLEIERRSIEAIMPNLRQKLNDVRAKHANLESKIAQQERTISSNKNRLTRLRTLEKEEQRFIEKNSNLEREWQRLEVKAQNLLNKESYVRSQQEELYRKESSLSLEINKISEDQASQRISELEKELRILEKTLVCELDKLKSDRAKFESIVEERAALKLKSIESKILNDAQTQRRNIIDSANNTRKRALELIGPLPTLLKRQFAIAGSFAKPPHHVINEINEMVEQLSRRLES
jgi:flagellar basal body rod protein FlgC